jgi:hypothetical protein
VTEIEARLIVREIIEESFNLKATLKKGAKIAGGSGLGAAAGAWLGAGLGYMKDNSNKHVKYGAKIGAAVGAPIGALLAVSSRFRKAFKAVIKAIAELSSPFVEIEQNKRKDVIANFKTDGMKSIKNLEKTFNDLVKVSESEGCYISSIDRTSVLSKIDDLKKMHSNILSRLKKCDELVCEQYSAILDFYKYVENVSPEIEATINKFCKADKSGKAKPTPKSPKPTPKSPKPTPKPVPKSDTPSPKKEKVKEPPKETKPKFEYVPYWERWKDDDDDDMSDNFM